jgi:hypothetical protein
VDDHTQRPAGAHGDGRLHIEIAFDQALAGAVVVGCVDSRSALTRSLSVEPKASWLPTPSTVARATPDLVGETGVTGGVSGRQVVDHERGSVGEYQALPNNQRTLLTEGDNAVIRADEPRALRHQEMSPRCRVEDVLGYLRNDKPGRSELRPVTRLAEMTVPATADRARPVSAGRACWKYPTPVRL